MRRLRWFGFWTLLGVVSSAQLHFANQRFAAHPPSWWQALATGLPHWYLWGLLALVVAWLGRRFQVDRANFDRHFFVRTSDVDWMEAARNYVRLHVGHRTHLLRATLGALEQRLDPERFRRVSRSALVNVDRVREVQPWFHGDAVVILDGGARLPLSRRYRANLLGTPVS